ncbi:MAG: hypothetical protein R3174_14010 [Gammaproteobacteria bacterium]|nr:hypothetical protein [Gammaproteobacteria bacterium]
MDRRPVSFVPLGWRRELLLQPEEELHAWLICDLDANPRTDTDWRICPHEVLGYEGRDEKNRHLSALITTVGKPTGYGKGGMRIQIPENIRSMGWLPERNQEIVIVSDAAGLSVWWPEAFERHSVALSHVVSGGRSHSWRTDDTNVKRIKN